MKNSLETSGLSFLIEGLPYLESGVTGLVYDVIIISDQKSFLINRPGPDQAGGEITLQLSNLKLAYQLWWPSQPVFRITDSGLDIPGGVES